MYQRLKVCIVGGIILLAVSFVSPAHGQTKQNTTYDTDVKPNAQQEKKASDWVQSLHLNNPEKEVRVQKLIANHLMVIRNWHNSHPYTLVPAGINPETGRPLSKLDRQMIVDSSIPDSVHQNFMNGLRENLNKEQVAAILDKYTIGKVAFTLKGYKTIVPDLNQKEETAILGYLDQAREEAIDYKNVKEISAIFEIYKTKCENYLNAHGRNWRALYKAYYDKVHSKK